MDIFALLNVHMVPGTTSGKDKKDKLEEKKERNS